ncbi:hypothetical protein RDI58_010534 [Solanum bulbocastanum]|uniref:Uncharacterized protein n=1 Tax=Solanum bulbocastanum TaxID=147425 RepID=A0AAN8TV07_SOLBU
MSQISNLRLLFSSANHHALLTSPSTPKPPLSLSHLFKIKHPFPHTHKPRRLLFAAYSRKLQKSCSDKNEIIKPISRIRKPHRNLEKRTYEAPEPLELESAKKLDEVEGGPGYGSGNF